MIDAPESSTEHRGLSRFQELWIDKSEWLLDHSGWTMLLLAILGLAFRFRWLNLVPLVAGDQSAPDVARLATYFPWPGFWDPTNGLGGRAVAFNAFRFPIYMVYGLVAHLGFHWNVAERIAMYLPGAAVLPIAPWWLARQIMGKSRWTFLVPLLFVANPYILVTTASEPPLAISAAISCFTIGAFILTVRRRSVRWAIFTGLFMALSTAVDIRPSVVTAYLLVLYGIIVIFAEPKLRIVINRLFLALLAAFVYIVLQFTWILPTLLYHVA